MRLSAFLFTLLTAGPALAHGTHVLPAAGHDHGGSLVMSIVAIALLAMLAKRSSRTDQQR